MIDPVTLRHSRTLTLRNWSWSPSSKIRLVCGWFRPRQRLGLTRPARRPRTIRKEEADDRRSGAPRHILCCSAVTRRQRVEAVANLRNAEIVAELVRQGASDTHAIDEDIDGDRCRSVVVIDHPAGDAIRARNINCPEDWPEMIWCLSYDAGTRINPCAKSLQFEAAPDAWCRAC